MSLLKPGMIYMPPSISYPLGTDQYGRDVLSRVIWGTRISLLIGFVSAGISAVLGIVLGAISGYYGGRVDNIIMGLVDIFLTLPTFFLIMSIAFVFGGSVWNVMVIIGLTIWPGTARLVRAEFLSLKEREFVKAARVIGSGEARIIFGEILPNAIFVAIVNTSLQVAGAIMTEASLSFLGIGDPNTVSWGWMLNDALKTFRVAWWTSFFPGLAISITAVAFNLIGDGLNDTFNPHLKER
jgi:peptide/nickel transport system permease protein